MNVGIVSIRYARALLKYSIEKKIEDRVCVEVQSLVDSFTRQRSLYKALENPILTIKDKIELIKLAGGGNVSDAFVRFAELVLHQRRENYLHTIGLVYLDLYRDYKHISVARLITASPIDSEAEGKVRQLVMQQKTGELKFITEVDPTIIGGFKLYIDTYRLDASVTAQLKRIREQLLSKNGKTA